MGLYTTAAAFGAGYALGRPGGRAQLERYLRRTRDLAGRPEAKRLRERGWDLAGQQVASVKRRLDARTRTTELDPTTTDHDSPSTQSGRGRTGRGRGGWGDWGRRARRRSHPATATTGTGVVAADVMPHTHEVPPTDPDVGPSPAQSPVPSTSGFGGTTIEEDSRAALGFPTLPPLERPDAPGPAPTAP